MTPTPEQRKVQLRGEMINRRLAVSPSKAEEAAKGLWPSLQKFPNLAAVKTVAGFIGARGEIPTEPLLRSLLESGRSLVLPRTQRDPQSMVFCEVPTLAALTPGAFGIPEPPATAPIVSEKEIDLVLVPGTAFDPMGGRVGFGKGFYDQSIPLFRPGVQRIGIGYAFQVVDEVPQVTKDQKVHWILTDEGLWMCA